MDLSNIRPAVDSVKEKTRIGRGQGSGKGGTSTRGHKGAKSRSGYSRKIGFEGGQMPLQRRLPKWGFRNINHVEYRPVNINRIVELANANNSTNITIDDLISARLVKKNDLVKILAKGTVDRPITVEAHAFSAAAQAAIENAGGSVIKVQK